MRGTAGGSPIPVATSIESEPRRAGGGRRGHTARLKNGVQEGDLVPGSGAAATFRENGRRAAGREDAGAR